MQVCIECAELRTLFGAVFISCKAYVPPDGLQAIAKAGGKFEQAYFYEWAPNNRLERPLLFSYEESVFALSTFCRPPLPSLVPIVRYKKR